MKIDGFGGITSSNKTDKSKKSSSSDKKKGVDSVAASPEADSDQVELDDHSKTLETIQKLVQSSPDVRSEEVERILGEIRGGRYKINFEKVAEGFIKDAIMNEMSKKGAKQS